MGGFPSFPRGSDSNSVNTGKCMVVLWVGEKVFPLQQKALVRQAVAPVREGKVNKLCICIVLYSGH